MIASVRGRVSAVNLTVAVVDVGGVGIQVWCSPNTLSALRVGDEATLATSMVVREDSLTLYGFADDDERTLFELLQTASGVGPKLAQAMLAVHGPDELRRAVATEDLTSLTKVPGVGRKGAQRIVLELKDRIGAPDHGGAPVAARPNAPAQPWRDQVHGALLGLGWSARDAESAVDAVAGQAGDEPDVPALLRAALRTLSKA
ncbi:MAG: Holliday junction branch migration protein RuvA [Propionibacteriales bacterium]|nr:Holliday junction branch migration protein RuvA [Propionibacteriales bacterium]